MKALRCKSEKKQESAALYSSSGFILGRVDSACAFFHSFTRLHVILECDFSPTFSMIPRKHLVYTSSRKTACWFSNVWHYWSQQSVALRSMGSCLYEDKYLAARSEDVENESVTGVLIRKEAKLEHYRPFQVGKSGELLQFFCGYEVDEVVSWVTRLISWNEAEVLLCIWIHHVLRRKQLKNAKNSSRSYLILHSASLNNDARRGIVAMPGTLRPRSHLWTIFRRKRTFVCTSLTEGILWQEWPIPYSVLNTGFPHTGLRWNMGGGFLLTWLKGPLQPEESYLDHKNDGLSRYIMILTRNESCTNGVCPNVPSTFIRL